MLLLKSTGFTKPVKFNTVPELTVPAGLCVKSVNTGVVDQGPA